jgi:hypothetical protein
VGSGLPPSPVEFSSQCRFYKLSRSWLLGVCRHSCLHQPACEGFPLPSLGDEGTLPSLLHVFFVVIAYYSVSLLSLGGGQSVQGAMLIWPTTVCGRTVYGLATLWSASSQAVWALASGSGARALLVSPFNMKWRSYAWAGGVGESKFCLFWVVFPVRCISSLSKRFYFRRLAFCFLPLAAILESPELLSSPLSTSLPDTHSCCFDHYYT